jgi:uracil-DNA glycosylase family 4
MLPLAILNETIINCRRCPRLVAYREQVARTKRRQFADWNYWGRPVPGFGDPRAQLYILGLAPAAHGGNRTGRIFTGDRSGDWLYEALHRYGFANQARSVHRDDGLRLSNCYIGASVRCAPPDNKPLPEEFVNCRPYVTQELHGLGAVRAVIVLGKVAFDQYLKACRDMGMTPPAPIPRFKHGAVYPMPWNITLFCSFHPSQQNTFTGKLTKPMFHKLFERARAFLAKPASPAV